MYRLDDRAPEQVPEPVAEKVQEAVLCARCGYDLRGLRVDQRCPECAAPVRNSMRAQDLQYAAPEFLQALIRGSTLAMCSAIVACIWIVLGVMLVLTVISAAAARGGAPPSGLMVTLAVVGTIGPVACGALGVIGWWLLTTRDPAAGGKIKDARIRKSMRVCTVIVGACWLATCIPAIAQPLMSLPPGVYVPLSAGLGFALAIGIVTMLFLSSRLMDRLANRLQDQRIGPMTTNQNRAAIGVLLAAGLTALGFATQLEFFVAVGLLGTIAALVTLMILHARALATLREGLICTRDGEPIPGSWRVRRTSNTDIRDLR